MILYDSKTTDLMAGDYQSKESTSTGDALRRRCLQEYMYTISSSIGHINSCCCRRSVNAGGSD